MNLLTFFSNPMLSFKQKMLYIGIAFFIFVALIFIISKLFSKESFIGTDMHYGNAQNDARLLGKKERLDQLIKYKKGYLPGKRAPNAEVLEEFENVNLAYDPSNYEIQPDYHRTIQHFPENPNPIESLETPEFMIPKTYNSSFKYENLLEVDENSADSMRLRGIESTFKNIEKNKFYRDLLKSKCRAGNRSPAKNCGCSKPLYGES
jgi:hypothetical protein